MLVGIFFLYLFAFFMKMCSPPSVGSTFSNNVFCKYRVQEDVSIPKLASTPPLMGGHFRFVLCKNNNMFCRVSGKWPILDTLFGITSALACILKQIFIFLVLTLPLFLASFVDRHFSLRLHGSRPSLNGMLEFAGHKRSRQA